MDEKKCMCGAECNGAATCPACGEACPNVEATEDGAVTEETPEAPEEVL
ncbi:MAG: hypothetical protein WC385_01680 [Candidatus Paceibacterota bacterium]|jgi:hypothetical protein